MGAAVLSVTPGAKVAILHAECLEAAGSHSERDTVSQPEDTGLSFCVGKYSLCLSNLKPNTYPSQLYRS